MVRRRVEEEDEEHAATVLMANLADSLDEDALTPRAAPRRGDEETARLILPEPAQPPAPLTSPNAPNVSPNAPTVRRPAPDLPPAPPPAAAAAGFEPNPRIAWGVAAAAAVVVLFLGVWTLL